MHKKSVVIVDDSMVMRALLRAGLLEDGRFDIVGEAGDPYEAREIIKRTNPDVVTLDIEMPRMDGLSFLDKIMRLKPLPVVMFSTETHRGSVAAVEALSLGAVDCVGKPATYGPDAFRALAERVFVASNARVRGASEPATSPPSRFDWNGRIVVIGASTGGVDALERLLSGYPENCPPTLITQHMPESFLASFAERLSKRIRPDIALAGDGELLRQGSVRIAPGGPQHLTLAAEKTGLCSRLVTGDRISGHRPSVDALFASARQIANRCIAVLLTGMGRDGADGMLQLRHAGAATIAQDEESSVVFGMPRAAIELGGASETVHIDRIARAILEHAGRKRGGEK